MLSETPGIAPSDRPVDPGSSKTLVEHIYQRLRREIVHLNLQPGSKLLVEELRARYKVSSSAMREALLWLVADCLVTTEPQRGFRVSPMSIADYSEITRLRKILERMALVESIAAGDDHWEAEVVAAWHRLSLVDMKRKGGPSSESVMLYNARNAAFHDALAAASSSQWVNRFRRVLYNAAERYRMLYFSTHDFQSSVHKAHKAILKAALARDVELACRLTDEHIDTSYETFVASDSTWPGLPPAASRSARPLSGQPAHRGDARLNHV